MYAVVLFILLILASTSAAQPASIVTHDNQHPAGTLKDGILTLSLRAGTGIWHPEGGHGPGIPVNAFAEADGPLVAPSPIIRVPENTVIAATIRNDLDTTLSVHGLCERGTAWACEPIAVPAAGARTVRFRAGRAGTYYWWASSSDLPFAAHVGRDSQMAGAFIVDPPNAPANADRVFVFTEWASLTVDQLRQAFATDDPILTAISFRPQFGTMINARSWPETERLTYQVGDTVKWRVINVSPEPHPLHLHGFYFDVDSVGDAAMDRAFDDRHKPRVVTQLVPPGGTMSLTWKPERAGNWLFHCHIMEHVSADRRLSARHEVDAGHSHADHDGQSAGMAGMVLGISVLDRSVPPASLGDGDAGEASDFAPIEPVATVAPRKMTLTMRSEPKPGTSGTPGTPQTTYGFVLTEGVGSTASAAAAPGAPALTVPGPTLVLRQNEPVEITLVNQLAESTSVHWHGMELESYYDGVHGFSGVGSQLTPMIAPGASFTVRFTPPRAGTFIYHTHVHDDRQLTSGLYGAMVVVDPAEPPYDPVTDHTLVVGRDGVGPAPVMVLNGSTRPQFAWRAGRRHRLRLVNITRHDIVSVSLMSAAGPVQWRPLTKDGAPVPSATRDPRAATQLIAVGETYDFEYEAPATRQTLWVEVRDAEGDWRVQGRAIVK